MCPDSKRRGRFQLIEFGDYLNSGIAFNVNHGNEGSKSPLSIEILDKFVNELLAMRSRYSRVCAIRFDLHVPDGMHISKSNILVSQLFIKLKDKFKAKKWDNQPIRQFVYGWVAEIESVKQAHYHLWIALPGNQVNRAGFTDYGIFKIIKEIWSDLTSGKGKPYWPKNPAYMIARNDDVVLREFVYRVSYLAKERGKYSFGDNTKRYGGSRLHGKIGSAMLDAA